MVLTELGIPAVDMALDLCEKRVRIAADSHGVDCITSDDGVDYILISIADHRTENRVLSIQPWGGFMGDKKLAAVAVRAGIRHG